MEGKSLYISIGMVTRPVVFIEESRKHIFVKGF